MKNIISLNGSWNLYYYNEDKIKISSPNQLNSDAIGKIMASVPGNVELDLANAGIISKELFKGMTTIENEKFEDYDWWYEKEFTVCPPFERVFLSFGAVDCFAEYYINEKKVYESENAFMEIRFEVTNYINVSESNKLQVHIKPAVKYAFSKKFNQFLSQCRPGHQTFVRKSAHSFGWDIFPRAVSAGLWRDVNIITDDGCEFEECSYFVESADELSAKIHFQISIDAPYSEFKKNILVRVSGKCKDSVFTYIHDMHHFKAGSFKISLENPYLWWPYGYGDANIYDLTFELIIDNSVKAYKSFTMGIRTVELKRTETMLEKNHCFKFVINGVDIMCKGSNWVPLDAYHSRDKEKYQNALSLFSDTHCNILRVWGGGVYEGNEFYDYCDRHGIMVWQDFMMACHTISLDDKTVNNIKNEVEWAVKTLRSHPSIILWSGDNEIDETIAYNKKRPGINKITREIIPSILEQNDSYRPYLASSPYLNDDIVAMYAKSEDIFPERHLWGARDYFKADFYSNSKAHFVSETGYHGCPSLESVKKIVDKNYIWPIFNEQWALHSSDQNGSMHRVQLMWDQIKQLFGFEPKCIEDFIKASQISQAEAKKYFIERVRIKKPYTSGIIWWNMLDGWPQMSDAVVDYFFNKKLAYDYIKRSQTPVALMFDELKDWNYTLYITNDTLKRYEGKYEVSDIETGEILLNGNFISNPNANTKLSQLRIMYSEQRFLVIKWIIGKNIYYNHYLCGMPAFNFNQYCAWFDKFNKIISDN